MISEPGLLSQLQKNGWLKAQRFAWSKIAADTKALYEEYIARKAVSDLKDARRKGMKSPKPVEPEISPTRGRNLL